MTLADFLSATGETQRSFGDRIGVSQAAIAKYVKKERIPRPEIMARIVGATEGQVSAADFYEIIPTEAA